MSFASGVGGAVAGAAVGYVVRGRAGGVVGAVLGGVGGYNIDAWTSLVVPAVETSTEKQSPPRRLGLSSVSAGGAANRASADRDTVPAALNSSERAALEQTQREWITAAGYDPAAEIVASVDGDPWGSVRVRRSYEYEFAKTPLESVVNTIFDIASLGIKPLVEAGAEKYNREQMDKFPFMVIFNPDHPLATWTKNGPPSWLSDSEVETQRRLYGPTDAAIFDAWKNAKYWANVGGKRVILSALNSPNLSIFSYPYVVLGKPLPKSPYPMLVAR